MVSIVIYLSHFNSFWSIFNHVNLGRERFKVDWSWIQISRLSPVIIIRVKKGFSKLEIVGVCRWDSQRVEKHTGVIKSDLTFNTKILNNYVKINLSIKHRVFRIDCSQLNGKVSQLLRNSNKRSVSRLISQPLRHVDKLKDQRIHIFIRKVILQGSAIRRERDTPCFVCSEGEIAHISYNKSSEHCWLVIINCDQNRSRSSRTSIWSEVSELMKPLSCCNSG